MREERCAERAEVTRESKNKTVKEYGRAKSRKKVGREYGETGKGKTKGGSKGTDKRKKK